MSLLRFAVNESLTPGQVCWARSAANGFAGASEWTDPVSAMAI